MDEISKRTAVARILVDLIKADNVIDEVEMEVLERLEDEYNIRQADLVAAQLITFAEAVGVLRERMSAEEKSGLLNDLKMLARADGLCTVRESLLLIAVNYCLDESYSNCSDILTCDSTELLGTNQPFAVYIESEEDVDINGEIQDERVYQTILNDFRMLGIEFIYIPYIVSEFCRKDSSYIKKVLRYMSPVFSEEAIERIVGNIINVTTASFTSDLLCRKMRVNVRNTEPALLINIGSSLVPYCGAEDESRVYTEFLRINILGSIADEVRSLCSRMSSTVNERYFVPMGIVHDKVKYFGFYKAMLDMMVYAKSDSDILIDIHKKKESILLKGTNEYLRLKPNEAALYILMIHQTLFDEVNHGLLYEPNARNMQRLNRMYRKIYGMLSGSETEKDYNANIPQVVSHIRKAVRELRCLKNKNMYMPVKDEVNSVYAVPIGKEMVFVTDDGSEADKLMSESEFWKTM